jgi:hypothetical protein
LEFLSKIAVKNEQYLLSATAYFECWKKSDKAGIISLIVEYEAIMCPPARESDVLSVFGGEKTDNFENYPDSEELFVPLANELDVPYFFSDETAHDVENYPDDEELFYPPECHQG